MRHSSSQNLHDELAQVLPGDEYDLDAITAELIAAHGLKVLDDMDDYADIAIRHQIEHTDPPEEFSTAITEAIAATREGATTVWEASGVRVEIYGQSRARAGTPTPGARITIITDHAVDVTPASWDELWRTVAELIEARQSETDDLLVAAHAAQVHLQKAEHTATEARRARDSIILDLSRLSVSDYRIAKTLGIAATTVAAIKKKNPRIIR